MKKHVFLFPGQGSQKVGMGKDLFDRFDTARDIFAMADDLAGLPVTRLCFEGPMAQLTETINLQPAVTAVNLAITAVLQENGVTPVITAGHSLGEYSALCAAGVISPEDTFRLVTRRGQLMHREAVACDGAMQAIIGLDMAQVSAIVAAAAVSGIVSVANHNTPTQIIITGEAAAVADAATRAKAVGARAIPLKVSGPWHSQLMAAAQKDFAAFLSGVTFSNARCPVAMNATATLESDGAAIKAIMARQLCSPVHWTDAMATVLATDLDGFAEIGPGNVLANMLKKGIFSENEAYPVANVNSAETFDAFLATATG
ncbi:MAG: ACP S-malonyltransferase [Pseudomonadota bacterium]